MDAGESGERDARGRRPVVERSAREAGRLEEQGEPEVKITGALTSIAT